MTTFRCHTGAQMLAVVHGLFKPSSCSAGGEERRLLLWSTKLVEWFQLQTETGHVKGGGAA